MADDLPSYAKAQYPWALASGFGQKADGIVGILANLA